MRLSCLAPMGIPRYSTRDISLLNGKYVIPAGTVVLGHIQQIVRDPNVFKNPDVFDPSRFLNEKGVFAKNNQNIVFGTGAKLKPSFQISKVTFTSGFSKYIINLLFMFFVQANENVLDDHWLKLNFSYSSRACCKILASAGPEMMIWKIYL